MSEYRSSQSGRYSSISNDEYNHSSNNGASFSLQAFVEDIPFQFNPKYQTIVVHNVDIPEYDTSKIRDILAVPIDFTLEKKVLLEALEDVQRKKKEIEADTLRQQVPSPSTTVMTNAPPVHSVPILSTTAIHFPVNHMPPPSTHLSNAHPSVHIPVPVTSYSVTPAPIPPLLPNKPSISPSYHLPSVRDIYYPDANRQAYALPINAPPTILSSNTLSLPTPIHSTNSSPNSVKQNNRSCNNCDSVAANDLAATFDGALGSDDPFHDAELKSLNDATELRHLYTAIASANTVRR